MMEFVSWEDEIPNIWKIKNVPNHQPGICIYIIIIVIIMTNYGNHIRCINFRLLIDGNVTMGV